MEEKLDLNKTRASLLTQKNILRYLVFALGLLAFIFFASSPESIGPLGITAVILLIYSILVTAFMYYNLRRFKNEHPQKSLLIKSGLEALIPGILIAFNSIRQLVALDVIFISLLFLITRFYIKRKLRVV